jgi:formate C-acetyltransferase
MIDAAQRTPPFGPPLDAARREQLDRLRRAVLEGDNHLCFVERETLLPELTADASDVPGPLRYSTVLGALLERLSVPIDPHDVILGRMVEGPTGMTDAQVERTRWQDFCHQEMLIGPGHLTLDWELLLGEGLSGVARRARETAERSNTEEARVLADNARLCAEAVKAFAHRYADAARDQADRLPAPQRGNLLRAAAALETVPHLPARGFFEGLQSVWLVHMITSCVIGGRDYAFGRMDQYLLDLYRRDVRRGALDRETATWLMAHFLLKANEIPGTSSQHHKPKPVPSAGSKQYLVIGGADASGRDCANELSEIILEAQRLVALPQPVLVARIARATGDDVLHRAAEVSHDTQGLVHFMNDETIAPGLVRKGIAPDDAYDYAARGCSTVDLPARTACHDEMINVTPWLLDVLTGRHAPGGDGPAIPGVVAPDQMDSLDDVFDAFSRVVRRRLDDRLRPALGDPEPYWECSFTNGDGLHFHFDALLLRDCVETGRLYCQGGIRYRLRVCHFGSLATMADSLMAVDQLVFRQRRIELGELMAICGENFRNHKTLQAEIRESIPKFGNDHPDVDDIAHRLCSLLRDAVDDIDAPPGQILLSSIYTLINHNEVGKGLPATPDGRAAGEPLSENQSASYGMDRRGPTALFNSVSRIPLASMPSGGLNVKFGRRPGPGILASLVRALFARGGAVLGFTFVDRAMLEDARRRPEQYRSLLVRQTGYSEYFCALPAHEQIELIQRTEYR